MQRSTLDLWVGLFVIAGIGALLVLALKVGNMSGSGAGDTYQLDALFENVGGLKPRAPVKTAGVVVGRVAAIRLDDEKRSMARVSMRIDARYQYDTDTIASVLTSGLLGEQYIGLESGGGTPLKSGATLGGKNTQSALVLEKLIGAFFVDKASGGSDKK